MNSRERVRMALEYKKPDLPGFEDFQKLKKELGRQICFYSDMKSQKVLLGTSSDIEKEVRQRVRLLAFHNLCSLGG